MKGARWTLASLIRGGSWACRGDLLELIRSEWIQNWVSKVGPNSDDGALSLDCRSFAKIRPLGYSIDRFSQSTASKAETAVSFQDLMKSLLSFALLFSVACAHAETEVPPDLPIPVASFGAAGLPDGSLYFYGGHSGKRHNYNRDEVHGDFFRWKPGMSSWEALAKGEPSQGASLVVSGRGLIRIGGMAARNEKGGDEDLWSSETASVYDVESNQWTPLPNLPERRSSHDSIVVGDTLYVMGGWRMEGDAGTVWHDTYLTLDLSQPDAAWETHPQPFKRRALAVQTVGSLVYAIGGMTDDNETTRAVSVLDTTTGEWTDGPVLPADKIGGFGFAAVVQGGRLFASGVSGDLLELRGDAWVGVTKLKHPRYFHRLLSVEPGKIIAIGGASGKGEKAPSEVIEIPQSDPDQTAASDWPRYQGPRGDGTTPEVGWKTDWPADGPPVLWKTELGMGMAGFAIAGNRAFTAGNDGEDHDTIWCLDLETGQPVWQHRYPVPTQAHEMSIVPFGPASTPTVVGGHVFVTSREGQLLCLDTATGAVVWQTHFVNDLGGKRPVYGYSSSPTVDEGRIYLDIGGAAGSNVCLESKSGKVVWQTGEGEAGYATPWLTELDGKKVLVLFKGEAFELRAAADGELLARQAMETRDFCNCATPVRRGDVFFMSHTGSEGSRALAWGKNRLEELWVERDLGLLFQSGVPFQGKLLAFNDSKRGENDLRLVDLETGKSVWETAEVDKGTSVVTDDGHAMFLTNKGELVLATLSLGGLEVLQRVQVLGGKSYVQPALGQGRVLCRNNAGSAVCLDLR